MTPLEEITTALAAASATPDRDVATLYVGLARARLAALQARVAALAITVDARERELVRGGGQLAIPGGAP